MRRADNHNSFMCRLSLNMGNLNLLEPSRPVQACNVIAFIEWKPGVMEYGAVKGTQTSIFHRLARTKSSKRTLNLFSCFDLIKVEFTVSPRTLTGMLITTHDISNHFVERSDYPAIFLSTLRCVQICQYMYIHLKKEFFELHFSCTKHQCTTVRSVVRIGPSSLVVPLPLPQLNHSPASNCGRPRM